MNFTLRGIDHIQLAAPKGSEHEAREFWVNKLGLLEIEKPESLKSRGGCWFEIGAQQIHIGIEEDFRPALKAHPGIVVKGLRGLKSYLEENGVIVKEEMPIDGRERFFVNDPFGNRVEFIEFND